jgi:FdhD protein
VSRAARYEGRLFRSGEQVKNVRDALVVEHPLQIVINGEPLSITMQTPGDEMDLVRGLLYSEDIYRNTNEPDIQLIQGKNELIDRVELSIDKSLMGDGYRNSRQLLSVASCGICGRTEFIGRKGSLENEAALSPDAIHQLFIAMRNGQTLFSETGGCHGAAIFDRQGQLLAVREDIGRHNAVDKAIGALLRSGQLKQGAIMLVSGRVSYEIVSKCFMAG